MKALAIGNAFFSILLAVALIFTFFTLADIEKTAQQNLIDLKADVGSLQIDLMELKGDIYFGR